MREILNKLRKHKIRIKVVDNQIQLNVPKGVNARPILEEVKSNKRELISYLNKIHNSIHDTSLRNKFDKEEFNIHISDGGIRYYDIFYRQESEYIRYKFTGKTNVNIAFTMEFENIEIPIIEKTLTTIFRRHESLRTKYKLVEGIPMQYILDEIQLPIAYYDVRKKDTDKPSFSTILMTSVHKSFNLEKEFCAFVTIINSLHKSTLVFTISHANSDYNSAILLKKEIAILYEAYLSRSTNPLPKLKAQYRHYGQWVNSYLDSEAGVEMKHTYVSKVKASISNSMSENLAEFLKNQGVSYKEKLQNELDEFSIENQKEIEKRAFGKVVNLKFHKGNKYSIALDHTLFKRLNEVAIQYKVSPFILLLSCLAITFSQFSCKKHVRISVDFSTRVFEEFEHIVGWLTSDVILCLKVPPKLILQQFIKYVAREFFTFAEYRFYPHEEILRDLDVDLDMLAPMFINYIRHSNQTLHDFPEGHVEENTGYFNLGMTISEYDNKTVMDIRYNLDTYSEEDIERFTLLYLETLKSICMS